jgi:hypothetical protein
LRRDPGETIGGAKEHAYISPGSPTYIAQKCPGLVALLRNGADAAAPTSLAPGAYHATTGTGLGPFPMTVALAPDGTRIIDIYNKGNAECGHWHMNLDSGGGVRWQRTSEICGFWGIAYPTQTGAGRADFKPLGGYTVALYLEPPAGGKAVEFDASKER